MRSTSSPQRSVSSNAPALTSASRRTTNAAVGTNATRVSGRTPGFAWALVEDAAGGGVPRGERAGPSVGCGDARGGDGDEWVGEVRGQPFDDVWFGDAVTVDHGDEVGVDFG